MENKKSKYEIEKINNKNHVATPRGVVGFVTT